MSGLILPPSIKGISLSKLGKRKPQSLLEAAQHNLRDVEGRGWMHKSDPAKIHLNRSLAGPGASAGVVALQEKFMVQAGYAPARRDYLQAFEVLFTTPTDFTVDYSDYFEWCLVWTRDNLGRDVVLTADTHFDEGEPHLHILVVPVVGGEWVGNVFATPKTWPKLQAKFGRDVEVAFGLKLVPQLKGKALTDAANEVKERLTELLAPHVSPAVLEALLRLAGRKPAALVGPLGITGGSGGDGGAAFKRIAMSTGKGPKRERATNTYVIEQNAYVIENECVIGREKINHILVNVFGSETPSSAPISDGVNEVQKHATNDRLSDVPDEFGEVSAPTLRDPSASQPAPALHQPGVTASGLVHRNDTPVIYGMGQPGDGSGLSHHSQVAVDGDGLHSTQTPAGLSNLGNTTGQDDAISNRLKFVGVANSRQTVAIQSGRHLNDVTTRERDTEHEVGHWDPDRGEFVQATAIQAPHQIQPPMVSGRAAADNWVASEMAAISTGSKVNNQYQN